MNGRLRLEERPPRGRRAGRLRAIRRVSSPLILGLAVFFAAPVPLGGARPPGIEVLGALATAAPTAPDPTPQADPVAVAAVEPAGSRAEVPGVAGVPPNPLALPADALSGYVWPIRKARLTLPFGPTPWGSRIVDGQKFHDGLDLATFCGDRITAAHDGIVLAAGRHYDEFTGWVGDLTAYQDRLTAEQLWSTLPIVVVIDDGNGYRSMYAHFRKAVVKPGSTVKAGDLLGYEGATGRASGCHLHYGLFSPRETATFGLEPEAAAHMLLPDRMTARIDPLLVLPPREAAGIH